MEVLSLSWGKHDHSMKKLLPCPLCSVEAQVRHSIVCGAKRLWVICIIQKDELCNPASLIPSTAGMWTQSESLCTSFAHERWWKRGWEAADRRVHLCHRFLMLHWLLVFALSWCSCHTDCQNSVYLHYFGLGNCLGTNKSNALWDFIQWCFSVVNYILLSGIWAKKKMVSTNFIYHWIYPQKLKVANQHKLKNTVRCKIAYFIQVTWWEVFPLGPWRCVKLVGEHEAVSNEERRPTGETHNLSKKTIDR